MPQHSMDIAGRLVDASTGAPIEAAVVAIPALDLSTLSDASGTFRLARIPAGTHTFEIRHIAYGTRTTEVRVRGGGPLSLELRLEPVVLDVDPLQVEVEWRPAYLEQVGFYDRKAEGIGEFYDPAFVQRWGVGAWAAAPNLIREIILARGRGGGSLACGGSPQVIIDGRLDRSGLITTLSASGVGAVEVYHGAYGIPNVVKNARADPFCTTVIVWTRQWLNEYELERRRIILCESGAADDPAGLVVEGVVTDALTGVILPRSTVTAWIGDAGAGRREERTTADDTGRYRFCDLDSGEAVAVRPSFAGLNGELAPVVPDDAAVVIQDLTIRISQPGHLAGRVMDRRNNRSVAAADVALGGSDYAATSDEHGFFLIGEIKPGDYRLAISHPDKGDASDSISIRSGSTTDIRVDLSPDEGVPGSRIRASQRDPRLDVLGFYARRVESARRGRGYFFTRDEIESAEPQHVTDLLEEVPLVRKICGGRGCRIVSLHTPGCPQVPVYLDGSMIVAEPTSNRQRPELDRVVTPEELAGVEVYARSVSLPGDFAPSSNRCGAIVLWRRISSTLRN